jgi:hypothetical protein
MFLAARSSFEPKNQYPGVTVPSFFAQTPAFGGDGIFTADMLNRAIARGSDGYLTGFGKSQYRYGSGAGNDLTGKFANMKPDLIEIIGGGGGDVSPIMLRMRMLFYGGTDATAIGTPTEPTDDDLYMTEGITFDGAFTGVDSWSISITNTLRPRVTMPYPSGHTGADGRKYAVDMDNGPMLFNLRILQRLGADTTVDTSLSTVNEIAIQCVDQAGENPVLFTMQTQQPARSATLMMDGTGYIARDYGNLLSNAAAASLVISTPA